MSLQLDSHLKFLRSRVEPLESNSESCVMREEKGNGVGDIMVLN